MKEVYYVSNGCLEDIEEHGAAYIDDISNYREEQQIIKDDSVTMYYNQDQAIKDSGKAKTYMLIDTHKNIYLIRKRPIINPATGNFLGVMGIARPYSMPNVLQLIYRVNGVDYGMLNKAKDKTLCYELTERQHMVLFLYLNKYSNSEIADILTTLGYQISKTRVNDHLENLKYIFHVKTKDQLIEKAISYNYHVFFPRKLLKAGSYEIDDDIVIISP
jgi:DNA-binding CsgD family transcriptional regulator